MKANWVRHTTATTGTGPITLGAAVAGYTSIADHSTLLPDGCQVRYQVLDGNNRAEYIGTYTAAGTVLSIDAVIETLVAGVYDNTAPTALTLSGSAVVAIAAGANTLFDGQAQQYDATYICHPDNWGRVRSTLDPFTPNRASFAHGYLHFPRLISKLGFYVGTADPASTDTRCAIYQPNAVGAMGTLIYGTGHIDISTTGEKLETLANPFWLPAGFYWFTSKSDSAIARTTSIDIAEITGSPLGIPASTDKFRPPYSNDIIGAFSSNPSFDGVLNANSLPVCGWQS